ncbi:MAG: peptidyl-prolyl cis-trans isomerase [Gemmatimonadaceae bacterium]
MLSSMRSAAKWIWLIIAIVFVGGFVFYESSGLFGRSAVTNSTAVATVNGQDILYTTWAQARENAVREQEQRTGRSLSGEERERVGEQVFNQMVTDILLEQEYRRRGIAVSDDEIREAAQYLPPPELMQSPELQTEGRFDPEKYRRFLSSPVARQGGLLLQLEGYYRSEIPKQKLFQQVATDVYASDSRLWQIWRDGHDSAQMTFAALRPETVPDNQVSLSDEEIRSYFNAHRKDFQSPARATVSVVEIPRTVTAADSAAARGRAQALRQEILGGAKFEDVAKRESADSSSAVAGGVLPPGGRGRFVPEFEKAAYALAPGQLSEPVLTPFGYHLIRLDQRKGDTLSLRHILLRIGQSDSAATATDRKADQLSRLAAGATDPRKFDDAAKQLGLKPMKGLVIEGQPLTIEGRFIPNVSAWALGGARTGETSDLFDTDDGYFLARLDSLVPGGEPTVGQNQETIRAILLRQKKLDKLVPVAQQIAAAAAGGQSLQDAGKAHGAEVATTPMFTRVAPVPGVGQLNEAVGAAFGLPVGAISAPVKTANGVYVIRVDKRVPADSAAFAAQKKAMREETTQAMREQRVRDYLEALRRSANIKDRRKEIESTARRTGV